MEDKEYKHLLRVAQTDLDGSKPLFHALTKIKGVGPIFANAVCNLSHIDKRTKTGTLTEAQVARLEEIMSDPGKFGAPTWMLNRRKDVETGVDRHAIGPDLIFSTENDVKMMKKVKSYRGLRHAWGLPVRGQRTRSNFRRNKGKNLGVAKRSTAKSGRV